MTNVLAEQSILLPVVSLHMGSPGSSSEWWWGLTIQILLLRQLWTLDSWTCTTVLTLCGFLLLSKWERHSHHVYIQHIQACFSVPAIIVNDESKLNQTKPPLSFQLHTNEAYDAILGRLPPISHEATAPSHTSHSELSRESDHLSECCRLMFKKSFFFSSKKIYFYVSEYFVVCM